MFKPNADHIEELMRAKEICETIIDDMTEGNVLDTINLDIKRLTLAVNFIDGTLENFFARIKAIEV